MNINALIVDDEPLARARLGKMLALEPGVEIRRQADDLVFKVTDNGRTNPTQINGELKEGIGLGNTRSRLKELYGDRGVIKLGFGSGAGFSAEIQIPWRLPEPEAPQPTPAQP